MENLAIRPKEVWTTVSKQMDRKYTTYRGLTKEQVIRRVYRTRALSTGSDIFRQIEREPLCLVEENSSLYFLQFNMSFHHDGILHRACGWANPKLIRLLKYPKCNLFIDCTFKCVPSPFYQCLIIMVFDHGSNVYVPVMYCLLSGKQEEIYFTAFHWVIAASEYKLDPLSVTCDFEKGLIKAVRDQFSGVAVVGCLFHFKQALRRKMIKLKLAEDVITVAMQANVIDVLTIIPHDEIETKGIPYVKNILGAMENYDNDKWEEFWLYFDKTWMRVYTPSVWNITNVVDDVRDLSNRTNNPLER
jgi:hypothetical protein